MSHQTSKSGSSDYCYSQGYDAASGNYEPSLGEHAGQAADVAFCKVTGNESSYTQGYKDGYNDNNPNAGLKPAK